jgi:UDP-N-acetylmuramoyl-L-alanyl-D-glutamate--2,6-diaminopimelate ligase
MPTPTIRPQHVPGQRIADVVSRLPAATLHGDPDVIVTGIGQDSREMQRGDVYVARAGAHTHGIDHVRQALDAGAVAVLTDAAAAVRALDAGASAVIAVPNPRAAAGEVAAWVYGDPASDLLVIGITGTNGKTTTAYFVDAGLQQAGHRTGLIGTVETRIGDVVLPSTRTTPEATDVHALLAVMRERGVSAVVMEVSSHALALDRVAAVRYDVAAFTNLSQDHLDFHADMDDYFKAKALLFTPGYSDRGVIGVDDEWGRRLADETAIPATTVGAQGEWQITAQAVEAQGSKVVLTGPDGGVHELAVHVAGRFNVQNAAIGYVTLVTAGVADDVAASGIAGLAAVPGRMERVDVGQPFVALVDYAHTPDAVESVLNTARELTRTHGRVVVVLGCGGDRDRGKRPLMGAAAARGADVAVLTSDNPRSEDPDAILAAMSAGAREARTDADIVIEPDRRAAIAIAVDRAHEGDVIVVAGKGHEQGQEYADRVVPFDDRHVLREQLQAHGYAGVA